MLPDSASRMASSEGIGRGVEQPVSRHHETRRAEPALYRPGIDEGLLHIGRRAGRGRSLRRS
jgi:hypothetical protein